MRSNVNLPSVIVNITFCDEVCKNKTRDFVITIILERTYTHTQMKFDCKRKRNQFTNELAILTVVGAQFEFIECEYLTFSILNDNSEEID